MTDKQETWTEGEPECPQCGNTDVDWWDGLGYKTAYVWRCRCGAVLDVELEQTVSFTTKVKEVEP